MPTRKTLAITKQGVEIDREVKILIERVEDHREIYLYMLEEIDEPIPEFFHPAIKTKNIPDFPLSIRDWLGLGMNLEEENTFHSYRDAVEAKGVLVFMSSDNNGDWKMSKENRLLGFFLAYEECPVIFVPKTSPSKQKLALMRGFGHLLMNNKSVADIGENFNSDKLEEVAANRFAENLLAYDSENKKRADKNIKSAAVKKLHHREPLNIFGDRYVVSVLEAMGTNKITLNKASSYLDHIGVDGMHKLRDELLEENKPPL